MTLYRLNLSRQAERDADVIHDWLAKRSAQGAAKWFTAFSEVLHSIVEDPHRHQQAPEASNVGADVRNALFKTRRGHTYRALYVIHGDTVHVIAIRGFGQDLANPDDLQIPT